MRKFIETLQARREASKNEGGFSLIDVVITVAIIVALSVGGFVTYSGIVENAKSAAAGAAADQVYTAVAVSNADGSDAGVADVVKEYNDSANGAIKVFVDDTNSKVVAVHKDSDNFAAATDYTTAVGFDTADKLISARG